MKRVFWIALTMLTAGALVAGGLALAQGNYPYGPGMMGGGGGYGPGMMGGHGAWGHGGGMMGGGMMGWGPNWSQLPAEKQEQLRKVQVSTMQAMVALMSDRQAKSAALGDTMSKFPLDQAAAKKQQDAVKQVQDQMFALHLNALTQAQQIIGKETWEKLHSDEFGPGYGPGRGGPGMMGPGGRGPAQ
jgi:hypothetical protein